MIGRPPPSPRRFRTPQDEQDITDRAGISLRVSAAPVKLAVFLTRIPLDYIWMVIDFIMTGVTGQSSRVGTLEIVFISSRLACQRRIARHEVRKRRRLGAPDAMRAAGGVAGRASAHRVGALAKDGVLRLARREPIEEVVVDGCDETRSGPASQSDGYA